MSQTMSDLPTQQLGEEGDACAQCGTALAVDQRYCLNCGAARAEPRLGFQQYLRPANGAAAEGAPPAAQAVAAGPSQQFSMITAVFAIALLGVMLLLGVLIGKDDNEGTVAAAPATTTTTAATPAPTAAAPTEAAATPAKAKGDGANATTAAAANVEKGGSGSTEGIPTADTTADPLEQAKSGEDVVATGGEPAKLDPNGEAGAGSDAVCIGCP